MQLLRAGERGHTPRHTGEEWAFFNVKTPAFDEVPELETLLSSLPFLLLLSEPCCRQPQSHNEEAEQSGARDHRKPSTETGGLGTRRRPESPSLQGTPGPVSAPLLL